AKAIDGVERAGPDRVGVLGLVALRVVLVARRAAHRVGDGDEAVVEVVLEQRVPILAGDRRALVARHRLARHRVVGGGELDRLDAVAGAVVAILRLDAVAVDLGDHAVLVVVAVVADHAFGLARRDRDAGAVAERVYLVVRLDAQRIERLHELVALVVDEALVALLGLTDRPVLALDVPDRVVVRDLQEAGGVGHGGLAVVGVVPLGGDALVGRAGRRGPPRPRARLGAGGRAPP